MAKDNSVVWFAAGIGATIAACFAIFPHNESSLDKSYSARAPGEVRPAPVYKIPQTDVAVDMIPPGAPIENSRGMFVRINARHLQSLVSYVPLWYEVDGLPNLRVSIPVDKGQSLAAVEFTNALSLEGKTLQILGIDPHTKQRTTLYEKKFVGKRDYY